MQTHVKALPMLHTLRLCHRFGRGRFTDFPVELIKMIEGYWRLPRDALEGGVLFSIMWTGVSSWKSTMSGWTKYVSVSQIQQAERRRAVVSCQTLPYVATHRTSKSSTNRQSTRRTESSGRSLLETSFPRAIGLCSRNVSDLTSGTPSLACPTTNALNTFPNSSNHHHVSHVAKTVQKRSPLGSFHRNCRLGSRADH